MAVQPDGKILVATDGETANADLAVVRLDASGDLDPTWGTGGVVVRATATGDEAAVGIALQPDGKVLVAAATDQIRVVRLDSTGALDPTWGTGGTVATGLHGGGFDGVGDLFLLPDGRVLVAGSFLGRFALARYQATGQLDPTFAAGGIAVHDFGASGAPARIARQGDGKILLTGTADDAIVTARFFPTGILDPGFGTSGVVITTAATPRADAGRDLHVTPTGEILVLGQDGSAEALEPTRWLVLRYDAWGVLDPAWGVGGVAAASVPGPTATGKARALALQGDGKVLVVGESIADFTVDFDVDVATVRFGADGELDASWGTGGVALQDFGSPSELGTSAVLQSDAKLLVAGTHATTAGILVARFDVGEYCGDGILQPAETCDDGNAEEGDCCDAGCAFESAGSVCTDEGVACTADTCDGAGTCLHDPLPEGASCEDGNPCTRGETCLGGACDGGVAGGADCANPFVCYKTNATRGSPKFPGLAGLGLEDEIETGSFDVKSPFELCVPAAVNDVEVLNPDIRQVVYKLRPSVGEPRHEKQVGIVVRDHFGTHRFDTRKVEFLFAPAHLELGAPPAAPAAGTADSYKCYKIKLTRGETPFSRTTATATDEFEDRFYDVYSPRRLCYPVDRDGQGIVDPDQLLTCYRTRRAALQPAHERVVGSIHTADELGALRLDTSKERDLCVPATLLSPPP